MSKESNWIPVSERLPDDNPANEYIIYCYTGIKISKFIYGKFCRAWDLRNYYKVTHWQPLPEPPQSWAKKVKPGKREHISTSKTLAFNLLVIMKKAIYKV